MKQKEALKILNSGHNVLLTGAAGSGKTYLLNKYINSLKQRGVGVAITASTGIAATHIGGRTIHSWSGIGIKDSLSRKDLQNLAKKSYLKKQFEKTEVLVIDEVSMLSAQHLDMVNAVCQTLKKNHFPFGGLQIVMSGDFFQLPPIAKNGEDGKFVYESEIWEEMDVRVCYLQEQYRQTDKALMSILHALRQNVIDKKLSQLLLDRLDQVSDKQIRPIRLFTHNVDVDEINQAELNKINEDEHHYLMTYDGEPKLVEALKKNCLAPSRLVLKKGALVMFVKNKFKNEEAIYVNGSAGIVVGFHEESYPIVRLNNGDLITVTPDSWTIDDEEHVLARINQLPLRLAWAITIHKSQGMTLERAEIDLSRAFSYGMGYVALSRLKTLDGLYLMGINDMAYGINPRVLAYNEELLRLSKAVNKQKKYASQKKQGSLI